jgi:hypothetical protein
VEVDLTGFIGAPRQRILFLGSPFFAQGLPPELGGTFVPKPDWFCSRCGAFIAPLLEPER